MNNFKKIFVLSLIGFATLFSGSSFAQGYIDCATVIADDESFQESYGSFTENGYTYLFTNPSTSTVADQFFPVINGSPYYKSTNNFFFMGYLAVWDNNCNQVLGTYVGGTEDNDMITSVKIDTDGNIIVTGWTESSDFMTTDGTTNTSSIETIFIRKYKLDGTILFSTIIGESVTFSSYVTVNTEGTDIYLAGITSSTSFSTTDGSTISGSNDVFAIKMDGAGNVIYSTVYGGSALDDPFATTISNGNLIISGYTRSPDFPTTDGSVHSGSGDDVFLTMIDNTGSMVFNTVIGGSADDFDYNQQLITDGTYIYIAGGTRSLDFQTTDGSVHAVSDVWDVYLQKYDLSGNLIHSKLIGGSFSDYLQDMELVNGELYLYGISFSADFPVVNGVGFAGGSNAFIMKFDINTENIIYSTLYGGKYGSDVFGFKVINTGEVYFTMRASAPPTTDGSSMAEDTYVIGKLKADGSLCAATQLPIVPFESHNDKFDVINDTLYIMQYIFYDEISTNGARRFNLNGDFAMMKFYFCPEPLPIGTNNLSPATQNVCENGLVGQISGDEHYYDGSLQALVYIDGVAQDQPDKELEYQWQVSTSDSGPWSDIGGPLAQEKNYSPPPTVVDQYYRRLTKTAECCGGATISTSSVSSIIVGSDSAPIVDVGGTIYTCPGSDVILNATVTGGMPNYTYSWNNGTFTVEDPTVAPTASSVYTLIVTDGNGCMQVDQATVSVYGADAGEDVSICLGSSTVIGGEALAGIFIVPGGETPPTGQNSIQYEWFPKDGTLSCTDCPNPTVTSTDNTNYTLNVTINRADGTSCTTTDMVTVLVLDTPINPDFAGADRVICLGEEFQLGSVAKEGYDMDVSASVVTQSSVAGGTATATNLSDNNFSTGGHTLDNGTIILDLGSEQTINRIQLAALDGFTNDDAMYIEVSTDNLNYKVLVNDNFVGYPSTELTDIAFASQKVRYIRFRSRFTSRDVSISEVRASLEFNYVWTPDFYITTDNSFANFDAGNLEMPEINPITYTVTTGIGECNFYDQVTVAVIEARAGDDGCGPRSVGEPDRSPNVSEIYSWVKITDPNITTGTGDFIGDTDEAMVPVSASVGGDVAYELTTTYTLNGSTAMCKDTVIVYSSCGLGCRIVSEDGSCPSFDAQSPALKAIYPNSQKENWSLSWSTNMGMVGLDNYDSEIVHLTDNVNRTVFLTFTSLIDPSITCTTLIEVNSAEYSTPTFSIPPTATTCINNPTNIGSTSNNPGLTYSWSNPQFLDDPTISSPVATVASTTDFMVTVTDVGTGCKVIETMTLEVAQAADAGPDLVVCDNATVPIGNNTERLGYTYFWSPNADWRNGTNRNEAQPDVFVANTQTFTLRVTDPSGSCTSTDKVTVIVESFPPAFTLPDLNFCPSSPPVTLGVNSSGTNQIPTNPNYSYLWSPSRVSDPTAINPNIDTSLPSHPLTYEVTVSNTNGCSQKAKQNISPTISPALVNARNICLGEGLFIGDDANLTGGGGVTYLWSPTTGLSSDTSGNPYFSPSSSGTYTFTVTKTLNGCSIDSEVTITVSEAVAPDLEPQVICLGESVEIGVVNDPLLSYDWFPTTGLDDATSANPTFSDTTTTNYKLTVINDNGCTAETNTSVTINSTSGLIVTASDMITCAPSLYIEASVPQASNYSYQWFPSSYLSNPDELNPTFYNPGIGSYQYELEITDQSTGCSFREVILIETRNDCIEICDNGIDDDGDGAIDCADSDCSSAQFNIEKDTTICEGDYIGITASLPLCNPSSGCSGTGITSFPYSNSFDNSIGDWTQDSDDDFNWLIYDIPTGSSGTGPSNPSDGSHYIYVESSNPNYPYKVGRITSPCFDLSNTGAATLEFDYHMYGTSMGMLELQISTDDKTTWTTIWSLSGDQGDQWTTQVVDLNSYLGQNVNIRFVGTTSSSFRSDMAIDRLSLTTQPFSYLWSSGENTATIHKFPSSTTTYKVTITGGTTSFTGKTTVIVEDCSEICNNGIDDDGDGQIDCLDSDCYLIQPLDAQDDSFTSCPGVSYGGVVSMNDAGFDNPQFSIISEPESGNVAISNLGTFEYTPTILTCEPDTFLYQVCNQPTGCCAIAQVVINFDDNLPPELLNVPADITLSCNDEIPTPPEVEGVDYCPRIFITLDENIIYSDSEFCNNYEIIRTWTASDFCGNTNQKTQIITVEDTESPQIVRSFTLPSGTRMIGGIANRTTHNWKHITFPFEFETQPLIFLQVVTANEETTRVVQPRNISTTGFDLKLVEEEAEDQIIAGEQVAWLAIEKNNSSASDNLVVSEIIANSAFQTFSFGTTFANIPNFIAGVQEQVEKDPVTVKIRNNQTTSIEVRLAEESSLDAETSHVDEPVGYLAIEDSEKILDENGDHVGESGKISMDHNWINLDFQHSYSNPIILFGGSSNNIASSAPVQIRNLRTSGCEIRLKEWEYLNQNLPTEQFNYFVFESGLPLQSDNCEDLSEKLFPDTNVFAIDNCSPGVQLTMEEDSIDNSQRSVSYDVWYAEDDCGNRNGILTQSKCEKINLKVKALLQGAFLDNGGTKLMRDDLRKAGIIPLEEPYTNLTGFATKGTGGGEVMDSSLLAVEGPNAIVDWVMLDFRPADDRDSAVNTYAGLLQRDGDIVSPSGDSILSVSGLTGTEYHVGIYHRNHVNVISKYPYFMGKGHTIPTLDFRTEDIAAGYYPTVEMDGEKALWGGDYNGDHNVIYQGPSNDPKDLFFNILTDSGNYNYLANYVIQDYNVNDYNLDGLTIFQGPGNDRVPVLLHSVLRFPSNTSSLANFVLDTDERFTGYSQCPTEPHLPQCDFDNDGNPNRYDPDDDNDGVIDGSDVDPYDPNSDSDYDGLSDEEEVGFDGSYDSAFDSDPLNGCDPHQNHQGCHLIDEDGDGKAGNYPVNHVLYDPDDLNDCIPSTQSCNCLDEDGDGYIFICHKLQNSTDSVTLKVPIGEWPLRLQIGDTCGECN